MSTMDEAPVRERDPPAALSGERPKGKAAQASDPTARQFDRRCRYRHNQGLLFYSPHFR